jgi:hypothetical protein
MPENTKAAELAAILGADVSTHFPVKQLRPMTLRLPLADFAHIEAIASQTSMSRGAVANMLIAAGIEALVAMLPEETVERIAQVQRDSLVEMAEVMEMEQE